MSDPSILCHPNIPKPLHGIAPRVIKGKDWWDEQRKAAYAAADFCCEACGVAKQDAKYYRWLEAHEFYEYDYKRGRVTFKKLVAICHACHNFIHNGRMEMLVERGEMTEEKRKEIMRHGLGILDKAGLREEWESRHDHPCRVKWADWRMVFDGKEYGPSSQNMTEWENGTWRNWKP